MKLFVLVVCLSIFGVARGDNQKTAKVLEANGLIDLKLNYLGSQSWCGTSSQQYGDRVDQGLGAAFSLGLACLKRSDLRKTETISTIASAIVAPWGEGKARILFSLAKQRDCAAAQAKFVGLEMSPGAYELYGENKSEPVGGVIILDDSVMFDFPQGGTFRTTGKKGQDCVWTIAADALIKLNRKK